MKIQEIGEEAAKIKANMEQVILGKGEVIILVLTALFAGGNVLMEDIPGTGKTKLAKALAGSLNASFCRIQFTPDLLPADITGLSVYNQKTGEFVFHQGPVFTNILLADEINRATPRTQSSLLECMEEKQVTVDGKTMELEGPFFLIATQNPIETVGTYPLPEAQLDRFLMQLSMGYPTAEEEIRIMNQFLLRDSLRELQAVTKGETIVAIQEAVKQVYVHESILSYIAAIGKATRECNKLALGINTRGILALLRSCQAYAAIQGRGYIIPEDVKYLSEPVLAHRLFTYSANQRKTATGILKEILEQVPVPTEEWEKWQS